MTDFQLVLALARRPVLFFMLVFYMSLSSVPFLVWFVRIDLISYLPRPLIFLVWSAALLLAGLLGWIMIRIVGRFCNGRRN